VKNALSAIIQELMNEILKILIVNFKVKKPNVSLDDQIKEKWGELLREFFPRALKLADEAEFTKFEGLYKELVNE
jgi:hypothetical protein